MMKSFVFATLVSSTSALVPPTQSTSTTTRHQAVSSKSDDGKPIFDPLGLYGSRSEERVSGRIRPLEPTVPDKEKGPWDRLGIYTQRNNGNEEEDKSPTTTTTRTIYDPFGLYPNTSEERRSGRVKALEGEIIPGTKRNFIYDPLQLYPTIVPTSVDVEMSASIPFLERPPLLDGTYAGDVGFDPFNFAGENKEILYERRDAELKHGRIAMLAVIGWPLSEVLNEKVAKLFRLPTLLEPNDKVPSLLNGGLETISPVFWLAVVGFVGGLEAWSMSKEARPLAGDYGFDPLNLYPADKDGQERMQLAEITHGRTAMLAITFFAYQELFTNQGVARFLLS